jgi:hypothetical protein
MPFIISVLSMALRNPNLLGPTTSADLIHTFSDKPINYKKPVNGYQAKQRKSKGRRK